MGRQNIGKDISDLLETVKATSTSSDSTMMMCLASQEATRRLEMEERRMEREMELEECHKDRQLELARIESSKQSDQMFTTMLFNSMNNRGRVEEKRPTEEIADYIENSEPI